MSTRSAGAVGERLAEMYLCRRGAKVLERNYRAAGGEVDLIVRIGGATVFVEVKQRASDARGTGADAVDGRKQRRISRTALAYLKERGLLETKVRFDVVEIMGGEIRHIEAAFDYRGQ